MKKLAVLVCLSLVLPAVASAEMTEDQKTFYALGVVLGQQANASFSLTPSELEYIHKGMSDVVAGKEPAVKLEVYGPKIQILAKSRHEAQNAKNLSAGKAFAAKAAKEQGAVTTASGLVFRSLKNGSGANPKASDTVKVNYRGSLPNGIEFDSSYKRGQPAEFALNKVIKCWTEGIQKMKVGGKAKLTCPAGIAYGERGMGPIPGNATLSFEVELLAIQAPETQKSSGPKK